MITQREAVYKATLETLKKSNVNFTPAQDSVLEIANNNVREAVVAKVFTQLKSGEVKLKATDSNAKKLADDTKLKGYVSSLVSNHWKRDPQLNGGKKV